MTEQRAPAPTLGSDDLARSNDRSGRRPSSRSRWAAVGAAIAVSVGAGGSLQLVGASDDPASFEAVTPTRILDTRTALGLEGPFTSADPRTLQVTGEVATPDGPAVACRPVPPGWSST